jgi:hypothetical protein
MKHFLFFFVIFFLVTKNTTANKFFLDEVVPQSLKFCSPILSSHSTNETPIKTTTKQADNVLKNIGDCSFVKSENKKYAIGNNLSMPIWSFNVSEFGGETRKYIENIKDDFFNLEPDFFLLRKQKIDFLIKNVDCSSNIISDNFVFKNYYTGKVDESHLGNLIDKLNKSKADEFNSMKSSRNRAVASFNVSSVNGEIKITRKQTGLFSQEATNDPNDWRSIPRVFKEATTEMCDTGLYQIIQSISKKIFKNNDVNSLDLTSHFTLITSTAQFIASNAPEGVHQDGSDYIVSALVVDRQNALNGMSVIYGYDKITPLFQKTLMRGDGIFQPDKGSDLWHTVTPIFPDNTQKPAYRSSIGFDINFKK